MSANWERARAVADAVLYEGYLLYPYRANSRKNQTRWQFGVLGPQGAGEAGIGEDETLATQFLVRPLGEASVSIVLRFLQLQHRSVQRDAGGSDFEPVAELTTGAGSWISWDEAVERELTFGPLTLTELQQPQIIPLNVDEGTDTEELDGGRLVRTRRELRGELALAAVADDGLCRLEIAVRNTAAAARNKNEAIAVSLIGTHLLAEVTDGEFVSLLEPSDADAAAAARCRQHRCFPVLAGPPGDSDLVLVSPIILYDHPEIAEQSDGTLFDATEIDEILTLRVMTMTDEEKAQARATDPRAAEIIDRCDSMSPEALLNMHGVLRDPHAESPRLIPEIPEGVDWWDPMADNAVDPEVDAVLVNGIEISRGSRVRLRPSRRADAQDLFFADRIARVTSVHEDVEGEHHIGVVIEDDPAADLHDWYGRYLYFSPDEVEPLSERNATWR